MTALILPRRLYSQPQGRVELSPEWADDVFFAQVGEWIYARGVWSQFEQTAVQTVVSSPAGIAISTTGESTPASYEVDAGTTFQEYSVAHVLELVSGSFDGAWQIAYDAVGYMHGRVNAGMVELSPSSLTGHAGFTGFDTSQRTGAAVATFSRSSAVANLFIDGAFVATAVHTYSGASTPRYATIGGRYLQSNRNWRGRNQLTLMFNRSLSEAEAQALSANPWQVFRTAPQRLYVDIGTGGASSVSSDLVASYILQSISISDATATHSIRASVQADATVGYAINEAATADTGQTYIVSGAVQADSDSAYTIVGEVASDAIFTHNIRVAVFLDVAAAYGIVGTAQADSVATYAVAGGVSADSVSSYALRGAVTSDTSTTYAVQASAVVDLEEAYAIAAAVQADTTATHVLRGAIASSLDCSYAVGADSSVQSSLASTYQVQGIVPSSLPQQYAIAGATTVDSVQQYRVRSPVSTDSVQAYGVRNAATSTGEYLYAVRNAVAADASALHSVAGSVQADTACLFLLRAPAACDTQLAYIVRGAAARDATHAYAVIGTVYREASFSYFVDSDIVVAGPKGRSCYAVTIPQAQYVRTSPYTLTVRSGPLDLWSMQSALSRYCLS